MKKFDILSVALENKATIDEAVLEVYEKGSTTPSPHIQEQTDGIKMFIEEMMERYETNGNPLNEKGNFVNFVIGMLNMCTIGGVKSDDGLNNINDIDTSFSGMVGEIDEDKDMAYKWLNNVTDELLKSIENNYVVDNMVKRYQNITENLESGVIRCISKYFDGEDVVVGNKLIYVDGGIVNIKKLNHVKV